MIPTRDDIRALPLWPLPTREEIAAMPEQFYLRLRRDVLARDPVAPDKLSLARHLATMAVGEAIMLHAPLQSVTKVYARQYLEDPHAQWKTRSTNQGIRATRIR